VLIIEKILEPRMTRIYTDENQAGLCLGKPSGGAFSNPFTSELARDCEITSPSRSASGPAFSRSARDQELPRIGIQKKHGARPACRDGEVFEKTSASLLAREFTKRPHHSPSEYTPWFFWFPIRVNL